MENKNKALRLASCLLIAVLLTTCAVSGTFAKYVTGTTGSDGARVAYWGFDNDAALTINLFSKTYSNVSDAENVIAPGTEKSFAFGFSYTPNTGKNITAPEVGYTFKVEATMDGSYDALDKNENFKWTLKSGAADATVKEYDTVDDLLEAIKNLSGSTDGSGSKDYTPGQLPAAFGTAAANANCTIGWKWNYTTDAAGDKADTEMGNATTLDNITLTITITATQID